MTFGVDEPPGIPYYRNHYVKTEEWVNTGTQEVMVFYPTLDEISDFPALIRKIEKRGAHLASGICKIVPPKGWSPRPSRPEGDYSDVEDVRIYSPVKEAIEGMTGSFTRSIKVYRKKMTVREFRKIALTKEMSNPKSELSLADLEKHYWRTILLGEPIYGADSPGSLFEDDVKEFNIGNLGTILDLLDENDIKISGVNTPFLYFGMWKTTFPWHVEDMDLYSINYLHYGEPKFWYAIPSQAAERFERLACQQFPDGSNICKAFLRHKLYIISPKVLRSHSIPYGTMVQYPNEIVITFPKGYHMGFNVGYNCAEAINFALERWIDFGKNAVLCHCRSDGVEIDMQPFMRKYRPDEFQDWYDYWYGERQSTTKDEKLRRSAALAIDPVMDVICTERQRRLAQAKRTVKNLWSTQPVNFFHEKEFNIRRARFFPHCSVCQYFIPRKILVAQKALSSSAIPKTSRRYVTDQLFHKDETLSSEYQQIQDDELLECLNCRVVVHKRCYADCVGLQNIASSATSPSKFLCVRCHGNDDMVIRAAMCALCELRGGALLEMQNVGTGTTKLFVHVICALLHASTRFLEPTQRRTVHRPPPKWLVPEDVENDEENKCVSSNAENFVPQLPSTSAGGDENSATTATSLRVDCHPTPSSSLLTSPKKNASPLSASARYECEVCRGLSEDLIQCHVCITVEPNSSASSLRYHITCAPLADMSFERRDGGPYAVAVCPFHNSSYVVPKPDVREITEGERVIVAIDSDKVVTNDGQNEIITHNEDNDDKANSSLLVGKGRVAKTSESLYCTVDFLDGSISTDLFPCDIRRCECQLFGCRNGSHLPGSLVYVQWHDGVMYDGYYRGKSPVRKYFVRLDGPLKSRCGISISSPSIINVNDKCNQTRDENVNNHRESTNADLLELNQDEVFTLDEPLPESVRLGLLKRRSGTTTSEHEHSESTDVS